MIVAAYLWWFGVAVCIGFLLRAMPPRKDSEGYQLVLVSCTWPVWIVLGLYYRLSNWVLFDLDRRGACT